MTYKVLARKWRPQNFADLVGQNHVVKSLTFALSHDKVHHAYLFTGTRGVGKTSIARIFAKSLNCNTNGITANPCGKCEICLEIKNNKFVDLIEVDAASRTGVDETRELIESVAYLPVKGRFKVYLIDEVHMFSKSSFNALLKTLEEPPKHVKFILATTDPEKLPITILSRCLQFNLKSLTQNQISQHLIKICKSESISYDKEALLLLASAGDGSMRDTLSITDQAIAYGNGKLTIGAVTEILGTIHPADIEAILFAIATNNPNQLNKSLRRLDDYEVDGRSFLLEIMKQLQRMAWAKEGIVEYLSDKLLSTVNDIPKPLLHLWYDIAEKALPNLTISNDSRKSVEITLLRMLAFIPNDWVPRQRTLLDESSSESKNIIANDNIPIKTKSSIKDSHKQVSDVYSNSIKDNKKKEIEFNKQIYASPVISSNNLMAAEANFAQQNKTNIINNKTENSDDIDNNTITDGRVVSKEKNSELQNSWHLTEEISDEVPPNMDEINTIMRRGSDLNNSKNKETYNQKLGQQDNYKNKNSLDNIKQNDKLANFQWQEVIHQLELSDYTWQFISLGILGVTPLDSGVLATLDLSPKHEVMATKSSIKELQIALQKYFCQPVKVKINITMLEQLTPSEILQQQQQQQQHEMLIKFKQYPAVSQIMENLNGQLIEKTIKAVEK